MVGGLPGQLFKNGIVAGSLERCYGVKALRYDGTVRQGERVDIEKAFHTKNRWKLLFV